MSFSTDGGHFQRNSPLPSSSRRLEDDARKDDPKPFVVKFFSQPLGRESRSRIEVRD